MVEQKKATLPELVSAIKKAGAAEKVVEFQYPWSTEVYFKVAFASKHLLRQIAEEARESFFNTRTRQQEERTNEEKFNKASTRELLKGWRGLTVGRLKKIVVGMEIEGADDQEVPFDEELAFVLMDNSLDLQVWVVNTATDVSNFSKVAERKKEQLENLP